MGGVILLQPQRRVSHENLHYTHLLLIAVIVSLLSPARIVRAAAPLFVKQNGTGDCSRWDNACSLQTALTSPTSSVEVWVATGVYKPTAVGTDRSATFQLKNGKILYGGFSGSETVLDQRDPEANLTILSGDIDNNDSQKPIITDLTSVTGNTSNSYQVVTSASGATLDGFTITAGYASSAGTANYGGGMYNGASDPVLVDVTFSGNWAGYGGGMFNDFGSKPSLTGVTFNHNSAAIQGGGLFSEGASIPALVNVTFSGNSANQGGGMFNHNGSNATLTNVTFSGNMATDTGGGMLNQWYSYPTLNDITFSGNSATNDGGGMYNKVSSSPMMTNVTFSGNSATRGGAIYTSGSSPMMLNVTISGNAASDRGGGLFINDYSYPTFRNTIFWGNTAGNDVGAQIYNLSGDSTPSDSVVQDGTADHS